jgi:uncharacterized membrane protein
VYVGFGDGVVISFLIQLVLTVTFFLGAHQIAPTTGKLGDSLMNKPCKIAMLVTALGLTTACATPDAPYYHTQNGALMGAAAGAVLGHQLDHRNGAVAGGLAGALIGGSVGNQMDYYRNDGDSYYGRNRPPPRRYYYRDYGPPSGYYYDDRYRRY